MTSMCCDCGAKLDERESHKSWCPVSKAEHLAKQKKLVDDWKDVPLGTAVIVTKDDGQEVLTTTRSHGEMLSGHTPVIWVDGAVGCYLLERVRLVTPEPIPDIGEVYRQQRDKLVDENDELRSALHEALTHAHDSCRGADNSELHWPDCWIVKLKKLIGMPVKWSGHDDVIHSNEKDPA